MGKASLLKKLGFGGKPPLPVETFRDAVLDELLRRHPDARIERSGAHELEIHWAGKADPLTFSVREAHAASIRDRRATGALIEHVVGMIQISSCIPTPKSLTVLVQPADYKPEKDAANPFLERPIVEGLVAVVVVDTVYGYQFLSAATLREELGMDEAGFWRQAMTNTIERLDVAHVPMREGQPTELLRADGLATSLLLVDEFWDPPRQDEVLVAAPVAPNKLIAAALADKRALKAMREYMEHDPLERRWRRFKQLLVRRDGHWEVLR